MLMMGNRALIAELRVYGVCKVEGLRELGCIACILAWVCNTSRLLLGAACEVLPSQSKNKFLEKAHASPKLAPIRALFPRPFYAAPTLFSEDDLRLGRG